MGLAGGDAGSEYCEQPVSASSVRGTRCGECQSRLARDFSLSRFSQSFPLDDFARRTIQQTALNIAMHRSHDVFERSKQGIFCVARDFYGMGGPSPISIHLKTAQAHAQTRTEEAKP